MRKFHEAKVNDASSVVVWGTGSPRREFLHVDDMADACLFLMRHYDDNRLINIGTGDDLTIMELALLINEVVGFKGEIKFDDSKPDGMEKKLLDVSRLKDLGWQAKIGLRQGIEATYRWYAESIT